MTYEDGSKSPLMPYDQGKFAEMLRDPKVKGVQVFKNMTTEEVDEANKHIHKGDSPKEKTEEQLSSLRAEKRRAVKKARKQSRK